MSFHRIVSPLPIMFWSQAFAMYRLTYVASTKLELSLQMTWYEYLDFAKWKVFVYSPLFLVIVHCNKLSLYFRSSKA